MVDKNSHETLIGAVVTVEGTNLKAVTDIDGNFQLNGLKKGTYTLYINLLLSVKTPKSIKILPEAPSNRTSGAIFSKVSPLNRKDLVLVVLFSSPLQGNHSRFSLDFP